MELVQVIGFLILIIFGLIGYSVVQIRAARDEGKRLYRLYTSKPNS